jgi:hypothetical protein
MTKKQLLHELNTINISQKDFYEKTGKSSSLSGYRNDEELPLTYEKLLFLLKELNHKDKIIAALNDKLITID